MTEPAGAILAIEERLPHLLLTFPHRAGLSRKAGFFPRPACGERVVKSSEARLNRARGRCHMREANDVKTVVPTASSTTIANSCQPLKSHAFFCLPPHPTRPRRPRTHH